MIRPPAGLWRQAQRRISSRQAAAMSGTVGTIEQRHSETATSTFLHRALLALLGWSGS